MTILDDLTTARANYVTQLVEISTNPKPSYSVNGQSFNWTEYQRFLMDQIERLDSLIVQTSDPYEIATQVFTG